MMRGLLGLLVVGCVGFSASVSAEDRVPTVQTSQFISTFREICLVHLDNREAQIAAAKTGPWKLADKGTDKEGTARFRSDLVALGVSSDATKGCSLTGAVDPSLDIEKVQVQVRTSLPLGAAKPMPSPDSRYWMVGLPGSDDRYVISLKVSNASGVNLATLNSSKL